MLQELKTLATKEPGAITYADRKRIIEISQLLDVPLRLRHGCPNCWSDQAITLYKRLKDSMPSDRAYVLHEGVDVTFRGLRINAETLTDDLARDIIARGFPVYLFAKHEEAEK